MLCYPRAYLFALLALPVLSLTACTTTNTLEQRAWDREYPAVEPGQALLFRSPHVVTPDHQRVQLPAVLGTPAAGPSAASSTSPTLAWYADRNDRRPATLAGYAGPRYEQTVTRTVDRTSSHPYAGHHGHRPVVTQRYDSTTYTGSSKFGSR